MCANEHKTLECFLTLMPCVPLNKISQNMLGHSREEVATIVKWNMVIVHMLAWDPTWTRTHSRVWVWG